MERKILGWENDQDENDLVASGDACRFFTISSTLEMNLLNSLTSKNEEFWKKIG